MTADTFVSAFTAANAALLSAGVVNSTLTPPNASTMVITIVTPAPTGAPTSAPTAAPTTAPTSSTGTSAPTPAPPAPKKITQSVSLTTVSITEFNTPVIKETYDVAYGLTIGIYDGTAQAYKTGCSVSSTSTANRRAGITVSYAATVSHAETTAAETAATSLQSNPAAFTNQVSAAQTHVAATTTHDTSALSSMTIPTASDVQAAAPVVITEAPTAAPITNEDLENALEALLLYIIIGAAVVVACVVGIIVACCCCYKAAASAGAQQPAGKAEVQMTSAPGVAEVKSTSQVVPPAAALPAGWAAHVDPASGKTFYAAPDGKTHWELPAVQA